MSKRHPPWLLALASALALSGCNQNTAEGNDREARLDPAPTPAPVSGAGEALRNVETAATKPETMSNADIQALGGRKGRCAVVLTEVAHPSFLYEPEGRGAIKLNGKLIVLPQTSPGHFSADGLSVTLRAGADKGNAGLTAMEMIVVPPGAGDEIGYKGYGTCFGRG